MLAKHRFTPHLFSLALLLALLFVGASASAQDLLGGGQSDSGNGLLGGGDEFLPVTEAFQLETHFHDGELVMRWNIAPEYYLYKARFNLNATPRPEGFSAQFSENTVEKYDEYFEKDMDVYYDHATLRARIPENSPTFTLAVESQGCADAGLCYPPRTEYLRIDPAKGSVAVFSTPPNADGPPGGATSGPQGKSPGWFPYALGLALLGGVILNLMPCVFPVLSIKVMSLAQADRDRLALHGWAYTAGIVASFILFGLALLGARAGGEAIGWGFQLQSPLLIAALTYLFFVMGLSLSGLVTIGTRWMGVGQSVTQSGGLSGSFFTGVLAAVVASPCTAPFMGAALGFALTQPALIGVSVFVALGLGMALPLLTLCHAPALVRHLPRPGPWMDSLKQALAFPLYLTAVWLLWVLGRQAGADAVAAVGVGAVAIAFAGWLISRRPASPVGRWSRHSLIALAWLAALLLPWETLQSGGEDSRWQPYSAERLSELRRQGKPVFVNLTADWCVTCLTNEKITLDTEAVESAFDRLGIHTLKGDWTRRDPAITELLEDYGRSGVPLYLWFPAGHEGPGRVLPQILRKNTLLNTLESTNTSKLTQN